MNLNRFTFYKKVSRWSAAILIAVALLSLISGFGLTNPVVTYRLTLGLLERGLSYNLHILWTPLLLLVFTWLHVFPRLIIESKRVHMRRPEILEILVLATGIISFVYFYLLSITFQV